MQMDKHVNVGIAPTNDLMVDLDNKLALFWLRDLMASRCSSWAIMHSPFCFHSCHPFACEQLKHTKIDAPKIPQVSVHLAFLPEKWCSCQRTPIHLGTIPLKDPYFPDAVMPGGVAWHSHFSEKPLIPLLKDTAMLHSVGHIACSWEMLKNCGGRQHLKQPRTVSSESTHSTGSMLTSSSHHSNIDGSVHTTQQTIQDRSHACIIRMSWSKSQETKKNNKAAIEDIGGNWLGKV